MIFARHKTRSRMAYKPAGASPVQRASMRYSLRRWSVEHARFLEKIYTLFADMLLALHWLWSLIGYRRIERPMLFLERNIKGLMFDCRMCGQCILSQTGMSCPMNCPKALRNGPCGGVRAGGNCEIETDMPCVWTEAWRGAQQMQGGDSILAVQKPVDQSLKNTSAWLRATAQRAAQNAVKAGIKA